MKNKVPHSSIPIVIGRYSNNEILVVELTDLPHLFISYTEEEQLCKFYANLIKTISSLGTQNRLIQWCVAIKSDTLVQFKEMRFSSYFITNDVEHSKVENKFLFWKMILEELKERKKKRRELKEFFSKKVAPFIIVLEDIFDMVITNKKITGYSFLQLLIEGPELNLYCIASSGRSYRNLIPQLLILHPKVKMQLQKQKIKAELSINFTELIITPENFNFYKGHNDSTYVRYFSIDFNEGLEE